MHVLSHTHWDREWYQDFQGYRQRLVYQVDALLDLFRAKPGFRFFHMDGQTSWLADYLEIRPEKAGAIGEALRNGRALMGPWFVMPDEFLVSGESMVRNLMLGHRMCADFGVKPMPVGYVTDIFGHCSQLPQLFAGFGIHTVMIHRGTSAAPEEKSELAWEGADGTVALTIKVFPLTGYNDFKDHRGTTEEKLREYEEQKLARATTNVLFALDGNDHTAARWDTPEEIARFNQAFIRTVVVHSSFPDYLRELLAALGSGWQGKLDRLRGELRMPKKTGKWNDLLQGIGSARPWIKQANTKIEWLLARVAEPLAAWSILKQGDSQKGFLDHAWRQLLLNHPHDSIVGCSIDQVHRDMRYRFDQAESIAYNSISESVRSIVGDAPSTGEELELTVINLAQEPLGPIAFFDLELRSSASAAELDRGLVPVLVDATGKKHSAEILQRKSEVRSDYFTQKVGMPNPEYGVDVTRYQPFERLSIAVPVELPAGSLNSWKLLLEQGAVGGAPAVRVDPEKMTMENEFLAVHVDEGGSVTLTDKASKRVFKDLLTYEDSADAGDGWIFKPVPGDQPIFSGVVRPKAQLSFSAAGSYRGNVVILQSLSLPADLNAQGDARTNDQLPFDIETTLTLNAASRRLEVKTAFHNRSSRHRLRALFPSDTGCSSWLGDTPFDVVSRPVRLPDTTGWDETKREEEPISNFVAAWSPEGGLAIITKGICEATVQDNERRVIALTVLRSFCQILHYQPTVDSLLLGEHTVEYALCPLTAEPEDPIARIRSEIETYRLAPLTWVGACGDSQSKHSETSLQSFIRVPTPARVDTIKMSEDEAAVVVRLHNPTDRELHFDLELPAEIESVARCNFLEQIEGVERRVGGGRHPVTMRPREIATYYCRRLR
ncbi:MAG: glycoside hydrolase family 38 C-terminal domain-containing protein [Verrucomicrobiota bacterium]